MATLLIIVGIAALALLLFRPAPRTQVIYVPVEVAEEHGGLGCLPLILIGVVLIGGPGADALGGGTGDNILIQG